MPLGVQVVGATKIFGTDSQRPPRLKMVTTSGSSCMTEASRIFPVRADAVGTDSQEATGLHVSSPRPLGTPPHCSAVWHSDCCMLEVNQNRIQAGRTSEKQAPLSSSENHPRNQKRAKVAHGG